jgi:hypothetical protein
MGACASRDAAARARARPPDPTDAPNCSTPAKRGAFGSPLDDLNPEGAPPARLETTFGSTAATDGGSSPRTPRTPNVIDGVVNTTPFARPSLHSPSRWEGTSKATTTTSLLPLLCLLVLFFKLLFQLLFSS